MQKSTKIKDMKGITLKPSHSKLHSAPKFSDCWLLIVSLRTTLKKYFKLRILKVQSFFSPYYMEISHYLYLHIRQSTISMCKKLSHLYSNTLYILRWNPLTFLLNIWVLIQYSPQKIKLDIKIIWLLIIWLKNTHQKYFSQ